MTRNFARGYTLLEVLLILSLMMILVTGVAQSFTTSEGWTRDKTDSANRLRIESAVELYKLDTGLLPESIQDLMRQPSGITRWRGPYLDEIPENPIKGALPYQLNAQGKVISE